MEIKATAPQRRPLGAYTVAQAAELLGVSASYLYEEIHAGRCSAADTGDLANGSAHPNGAESGTSGRRRSSSRSSSGWSSE